MSRTLLSSRPWTEQEICELRKLASKNTPTRVIAKKLDRNSNAVQTKAADENIRLNSQSSLDECMPIRNYV